MQTDKFRASYSDDWDDVPPEPAASAAAQSQPSRPTKEATESLAEPMASVAPAVSPSQAKPGVDCVAVAENLAGAATNPLATPVAIPMAHKLGRYPGLFARSAVFRIGRADGDIGRSEIACYGAGYSAVYEGPRLGMRDKSIWEFALREAKALGHVGVEMALPTTRIAGAIGGGESGPALTRIGQSLSRLSRARIDYCLPGGASGSAALLQSARKTSSGWRVAFDPAMIALLGKDKQFEIDTKRRKGLSSDLAKWLHDFMSTHKARYAGGFKIRELAELCGWRGDPGQFPSRLEEALSELGKQCPELIKGHEIQRGRRSSSAWRARIDKGPESECFEVPAKKEKAAKPGGSRRGGVSL